MASEAVSYPHTAMEDQPKMEQWYPPLIIEFIGTFMLVFTVSLNVAFDIQSSRTDTWDALAIGAVLMVMIFMGGHISGAHYNPAVSLAVFLRGKLTLKKMLEYWVVQVLGALFAAMIAWGVSGQHPAPGPNRSLGYGHGAVFVVEFIYTFALASVVLNVATTKSQEDNSFFGLAIGFTVTSGAFSCGPISGAVFNPAVGTGLLVVHGFAGANMSDLWIYWLAPLLGGALAALIFRITNIREFHELKLGHAQEQQQHPDRIPLVGN